MPSEFERTLLELRDRDRSKRSELIERGKLLEGYHPEMEQIHSENARALEALLDRSGWPRASEVGPEASTAAWMVASHAIGEPAFQRRCLELLEVAVEDDEAPAAHAAMLLDRIRFNERQPQVYGTLLDWDAQGKLSPWPIDDPDEVDERRRDVGLPPLEESVQRSRAQAEREGARAPAPYAERQAEVTEWARRVGWLED